MPSLGADMEAGTLVEWMRKPGDRVHRGDVIAAVETQKGAIEIEVFDTGVLREIRVDVGQKVPVGAVLAIIDTDVEAPASEIQAPAAPPPVATRSPAPVPAPPSPPRATSEPAPASAQRAKVTPAARRRAAELGVNADKLAPDATGVIGLHEVEAAATSVVGSGKRPEPAATTAPAARKGLDLDAMRKAIAAAMARSWREIPHYFAGSTLNMEPLLAWLARENAQRSVAERLLYAAPLIKATALALKAEPTLNGHYDGDRFDAASRVNLGIAIALRGGGLIAPAILDADTLSVPEVMARLNDLVARVRTGRLRSSELSQATATLSNLGEGTADTLQAVIYPPQVAIVGCGRIVERAWASAGVVNVRRTMTVTVGGDHRVSDGRRAAKLIARIDDLLQHPEKL